MSDKVDRELFQLPKEQMDAINEAEKRLGPLENMIKEFEELGYDGTQMKKDIERSRKQISLIKRYSKPIVKALPPKK